MSDKREPFDDLEAEIGSLRPRRPSADFARRIVSRLSAPPQSPGSRGGTIFAGGWRPQPAPWSRRSRSGWLVQEPDCPGARVKALRTCPPSKSIPNRSAQQCRSPLVGESRPPATPIIASSRPTASRLDRGELFVESLLLAGGEQKRPPLSIETPAGKAMADGTKFYIGTHPLEISQSPNSKGSVMTSLTRVLVLAGVVTLVNAQGSVTGQANHLLAAEAGKAPVNQAIQANSDFAVDLYRQLAKENRGKNLFFSPYSMSSALAMTAEGARGETAAQMGKVLCFPAAARRLGDDAQLIPWNIALIHTGMAALNERFNARKPVAKSVLEKIEGLRRDSRRPIRPPIPATIG